MPPTGPGGRSAGPTGGGSHKQRSRGGGVSPHSWAVSLLHALGAPQTRANINSIVSWEAREGGNWRNSATYNPLNTDQAEPGSITATPNGSQAYDSWQSGLSATVTTLRNGDYPDLLAALHSGKGLLGRTFPGLSKWSGGGYDSLAARPGYGGGRGGHTIGQIQTAAAAPASCAISLPSVHTFFGFGPSIGGECLLSKPQLRGVAGVAVISSGAFILAIGLAMIGGQTRPVQRATQILVSGVKGDVRPAPRRRPPAAAGSSGSPPAAPAAQGQGQAQGAQVQVTSP